MALHSLSLCTGTSGLDLGVDIACPGVFRPIYYVEREISVVEILAHRIESGEIPAAPIWSDVRTICDAGFRDFMGAACGDAGLGLLTAGYPCQPFSISGDRRGCDDPRHLWPYIARAIEEYQPALVFLENVRGHVSLGFREVAESLEAMGYGVAAEIVSAAEIGSAQRRERLFILACADGDRLQGRVIKTMVGPYEWRLYAAAIGSNTGMAWVPPGPPLPDDIDGWRRVEADRPDLMPWIAQSEIRRMADGSAGGVDRIRACGNGVVPAAAAAAFAQLLSHLI